MQKKHTTTHTHVKQMIGYCCLKWHGIKFKMIKKKASLI